MTYSKYVKDYNCNYVIDVNSNESFYEIEREMKKVDRILCCVLLCKKIKGDNLIC